MVRVGAAAALHLTLEGARVDLARTILRSGVRWRFDPPGPLSSSSLSVDRDVLCSLDIHTDIDSLPIKVTADGER
jgi:hypothetical protein